MSQQQTDTDTLDPNRLLSVLTAVIEGDLSRRLPIAPEGPAGAIAESFNMLLDRLEAVASEMNRITREVTEGRFGGQAQVKGLSVTWKEFPTREDIRRFLNRAQGEGGSGTWNEVIDNLNVMSANLTHQVRDISNVTSEVANGNASQRVTVNAQGEMLLLKELVNTLVDQLYGRQSQHSPGR